MEKAPEAITNPVTLTLDLQKLRESNLTFEQQTADMVQMLHTIQHRVEYLYNAFTVQTYAPASYYAPPSYPPPFGTSSYPPSSSQSAPFPAYPPPPPPRLPENETLDEENES